MARFIRKGVGFLFLFTVGLMIGAVLFAPMDMVWSAALGAASRQVENVDIRWDSISDASFTGVTVRRLEVSTPKATVRARVLDFVAGAGDPWLDLGVGTGMQKLRAVLREKNLRLDGGIDLGDMLGSAKVAGVVNVDGSVDFANLPGRPDRGTLVLDSPDITVHEVMKIGRARCELSLDGDVLTIRSFEAPDPMQVNGTGVVTMDWQNVMRSQAEVTGTIFWNGQIRNFSHKGSLRKVLRLVGG